MNLQDDFYNTKCAIFCLILSKFRSNVTGLGLNNVATKHKYRNVPSDNCLASSGSKWQAFCSWTSNHVLLSILINNFDL